MRVRTDGKRRTIIKAASALFVEQGYERTSMSAISERVGGSKATLYGYFESKEELLRAVLELQVVEEADRLVEAFPDGADLRSEFIELGVRYLTERLSNLPIANLRTVANQPVETGMGRDFYAGVLRPAWQLMADHFEVLMDKGLLGRADPWTAAMHWKGLNEGEILEKRLLNAITEPDPDEVRELATAATDAFLRIYGQQPGPIVEKDKQSA